MEGLKVYHSEHCGFCEEQIPVVKQIAEKMGWRYTDQSVENCKPDDKTCKVIEYVPHFTLDGKEVSFKELQEMGK